MSQEPLFPVVLVMLALDPHDPSVLDAIEDGAGALGAREIVLAHVSPMDPLADALGMSVGFKPGRTPKGLLAIRDRVARALPQCEVTIEHGRGATEAVLGEIIARRDVDLLILGRLPRPDSTDGWGPSGRKLLRTVTCSALIVPLGAKLRFDQAYVGLDFSSHAAHALATACSLAANTTAICQYDLRVAGHGSLTDEEFATELTKNAREHFEQSVQPLLPESASCGLEVHPGDRASDVLLNRADNSLLVVGSRGLSKLATILLGSTAERLAGMSRGPVLILRKKGEVLSLLEGLFHR